MSFAGPAAEPADVVPGARGRLATRRDGAPSPGPPLIIVVKGYPRISETFIAQEIAALERRGIPLGIVSLRRPYDRLTHPVHGAVRAPVWYLPEYLTDDLRRVGRGHLAAIRRAPRRYLRSLAQWLRDLARDPTVNRIRRFGQAGVLAAELSAGARHIHAHFLHTPASVARYAASMTGCSLSLSAHAKDVWTRPRWELQEKLRDARFCVTCSRANHDYLSGLAPAARVHLVYHGLDHRFFVPPARVGSARDGSDPTDPVRLLAVGRFQPKKGFDVLLRALAQVSGAATLTVVGYGPGERALHALAESLGLAGRVRWAGQLDHPGVRACYRDSDLFVLAPRVTPDGDRDGVPNVIVEALSQGLPVVATRVGAIPEIVEDGVNGRLVPPEDPPALAAAVTALLRLPETRARLGQAAIRRVAHGWDLEAGADHLAALLAPLLGLAQPPEVDPTGARPEGSARAGAHRRSA